MHIKDFKDDLKKFPSMIVGYAAKRVINNSGPNFSSGLLCFSAYSGLCTEVH